MDCQYILLTCLHDCLLQSDTRWGGLKGGQVMAQPKPVFARIEIHKEGEDEGEAKKKVSKKKQRIPQNQTMAEA